MQFECDSCNAKYKISGDKVRGRVVRFPCRKCDHKILIDGRQRDADVTVPAGEAYNFDDVTRKSEPVSPFSEHEAATARARRPSSPARRRSPSVPPRRPSAASRRVSSMPAAATAIAANSAFVGQQRGLTPRVPTTALAPTPASNDLPEWHVSVNDVPIGPIRLEEMAHKIDAGAVSEYSLVWRHGLEEWRPLATVPELMSLLHERRHSGPPPRSSFSSMPPFVETRVSLSEPSPSAAIPGLMHVAAPADDEIEPLADALQPEVDFEVGLNALSQPPAPLGPEGVFESSPQLGSYSGLPPTADDSVSVPSAPPEPVAAAAEESDKRISLGVWALILAVVVFAGVAGFLAFERFGEQIINELLGSNAPAKVATPERAPVLPVVEEPVAEPEPMAAAAEEEPIDATAEEALLGQTDPNAAEGALADGATAEAETSELEGAPAGEEQAVIVPPPDPKDNRPKMAPAPRAKPKARRRPRPAPVAAAPKTAPTNDLSNAEQKILDEFDSSGEAAPAKIAVKQSSSAQSDKPALDGDAVRETVAANKPRLQRCYERAIRGQTSPGTVRLDMTVTVASSGRVKAVASTGNGPGGLAECIEASVRRWRFPESSEGGPAKFPLVFSAN